MGNKTETNLFQMIRGKMLKYLKINLNEPLLFTVI